MGTPESIDDIKFIPVKTKMEYYPAPNKKIKYLGVAEKGSSTSNPVWKINLYNYDGDWDIIEILTSYGSWDDRASLTYL